MNGDSLVTAFWTLVLFSVGATLTCAEESLSLIECWERADPVPHETLNWVASGSTEPRVVRKALDGVDVYILEFQAANFDSDLVNRCPGRSKLFRRIEIRDNAQIILEPQSSSIRLRNHRSGVVAYDLEEIERVLLAAAEASELSIPQHSDESLIGRPDISTPQPKVSAPSAQVSVSTAPKVSVAPPRIGVSTPRVSVPSIRIPTGSRPDKAKSMPRVPTDSKKAVKDESKYPDQLRRLRLIGFRDQPLLRFKILEGRVVVAYLWASDCQPCRREMPQLAEFAANAYPVLRDQGLTLLTITNDARRKKTEEFVDTYLTDSTGDLAIYWDRWSRFSAAMDLGESLPQTLIIGRNGKVLKGFDGVVDWQSAEFLGMLRGFLNEGGGSEPH